MADKPPPPAGDDDRRIADAELLFGDKTASRPQPEAPRSPEVAAGRRLCSRGAGRTRPEEASNPFFDEAPVARPVVPPSTPSESWTREELEPDRRARTQLDDPDSVEQVWSRGAEWGRSLAILAAVVVVTGLVFAWSISAGLYMLALVSVLAGGAVFILCSYPILISLERPVRITPEQAVKDFYGALSHHVPHFRRMWLLLSTAGRTSGHFSNFPEFKRLLGRPARQAPRGARGAIHPLEIRGRRLQIRQEPGQDVRRCQVHRQGLDPRPSGRRPHRLLPGRDQPGQRPGSDVVSGRGIPPGRASLKASSGSSESRGSVGPTSTGSRDADRVGW